MVFAVSNWAFGTESKQMTSFDIFLVARKMLNDVPTFTYHYPYVCQNLTTSDGPEEAIRNHRMTIWHSPWVVPAFVRLCSPDV